jgi:hypothetical protein
MNYCQNDDIRFDMLGRYQKLEYTFPFRVRMVHTDCT